MPTYNMKNLETEQVVTVVLSLAEREDMLSTGEWTQLLSAPNFVSQHGSTFGKTSGDWKDLMKSIKKGSGKNNTVKA